MRGIVLWFVDKLLGTLGGWLHPDQAARWEAIKQRSRELDGQEAELARKGAQLEAQFAASQERLAALDAQIKEADRAIAADEQKLAESNERRKQIADDLAKTKADIAAQSEHDAVRADV